MVMGFMLRSGGSPLFFITPDGDCAVRGYFLFAEKNKSFTEKFLTFKGKLVRFTGRIRAVYI